MFSWYNRPLGSSVKLHIPPTPHLPPRRKDYVGISTGSFEVQLSTLDAPENSLGSFEKNPEVQAVPQICSMRNCGWEPSNWTFKAPQMIQCLATVENMFLNLESDQNLLGALFQQIIAPSPLWFWFSRSGGLRMCIHISSQVLLMVAGPYFENHCSNATVTQFESVLGTYITSQWSWNLDSLYKGLVMQ